MPALTKQAVLVLIIIATFPCLSLRAQDNCDLPQLMHQKKDVATIQHLEDEWSIAFIHGDTEFMRCLLIPEFTEITRSGELKFLRDELDMAARNHGRNLPVPELPKAEVLIYENVAVAYALTTIAGADGKPHPRRNADSYIWTGGQWHVFFSEQTPVEKP
jgi:Domain of unknown function (DUF4440)